MTKTKQVDKDFEFMARPLDWPYWPILPVKRRKADGPGWQWGFLISRDSFYTLEGPIKVLLGGFYELQDKPVGKFPTIEYASRQAILADGWVVD